MKTLPHPGRWIPIAVLAGGCSLAGGFLLDLKGFAGNALAELAGMVFSALLAVVFIDRHSERARRTRWAAVSGATTRTLEAAAVRAALPAYMKLATPRQPNLDPRMAQTLGHLGPALNELAIALRQAGQAPLFESFDPQGFLDAVLPSTRVITEVVLPRLVLLDADPGLIEPLVDLERSVADLDYRAWSSADFTIPRSTVFEDAADFVQALAAVVTAHTQSTAEADRDK